MSLTLSNFQRFLGIAGGGGDIQRVTLNVPAAMLQLIMLKAHGRLQNLYNHLSDEESEDVARKAVTALTQEMELFCNFCGQRYGTKDESLQALPCSHIYHEKYCRMTYNPMDLYVRLEQKIGLCLRRPRHGVGVVQEFPQGGRPPTPRF